MMLIIEFDKDYVRECPVCLARGCDKTLYDHCMLAFHLSGPINSNEVIVVFIRRNSGIGRF